MMKIKALLRTYFSLVVTSCLVLLLLIYHPRLLDRALKLFENTSWGALQVVDVRGTKRVSESEIIQTVNLGLGTPLGTVDLNSVVGAVESLPEIRTARVWRNFPGRLVIEIQEREPIALSIIDDFSFVDNEGVRFPPDYGSEPIDLPAISWSANEKNRSLDRSQFLAAVNLISDLQQHFTSLYQNMSEVEITPNQLLIRLRQGGAIINKNHAGWPQDCLSLLDEFFRQYAAHLPVNLKYVRVTDNNSIITGTE